MSQDMFDDQGDDLIIKLANSLDMFNLLQRARRLKHRITVQARNELLESQYQFSAEVHNIHKRQEIDQNFMVTFSKVIIDDKIPVQILQLTNFQIISITDTPDEAQSFEVISDSNNTD